MISETLRAVIVDDEELARGFLRELLRPHPEIENFIFANGFSGHGLHQSPATGRAVAELITHQKCVSIDLSLFGYERVAERRAVKELNII